MKPEKLSQCEIWCEGSAANDYFERNYDGLTVATTDNPATRLFASFIKNDDHVLEIGTSNGRVLNIIKQITKCRAYGIDPSPIAVQDGLKRWPDLKLSVGSAEKLEYADNSFDVVIYGFCLYLIDRTTLFRVVSEADRVLKSPGLIMITDFDPVVAHRRSYKHCDGVYTYKMNYPSLWMANPDYSLVAKISFSHSSDTFHPDEDERVASWVIYKSTESGYVKKP